MQPHSCFPSCSDAIRKPSGHPARKLASLSSGARTGGAGPSGSPPPPRPRGHAQRAHPSPTQPSSCPGTGVTVAFGAHWLSVRSDFVPGGHLAMQEDIFGCHNRGVGCPWRSWERPRMLPNLWQFTGRPRDASVPGRASAVPGPDACAWASHGHVLAGARAAGGRPGTGGLCPAVDGA